MRGRMFTGVGLLLVISATLLLAPLLGRVLSRAAVSLIGSDRVDLTQGQIYTLTPATENLLANISGHIKFTLYFSDQVSSGLPDIRNYASHVRDTLEEMVARSHGHLQLQVLDPAPFSEAEDAAAAAALQAVPANASGDSIYLGLVATVEPATAPVRTTADAVANDLGKTQTIPFFQPDREQFLEYELARVIAMLERRRAPVVGLVSSLPVMPQFDFASARPVGGWVAITALQQSFDLRNVQLADAASLQNLDVLVLIHPQQLSATQLYNLDQYVLHGGRLLAFVDPNAETQAPASRAPNRLPPDQSSDLAPLLARWGVIYDKHQFVADAHYALTVGMSDRSVPVRHLGMLGIDPAGLDHGDIVTTQLKQINLASAGALAPFKNATTRFSALISSSTDAALLDAERLRVLLDPNSLTQGLQPTGKRFTIAARVTGPASTAFPDGKPALAGAIATAAPARGQTPASRHPAVAQRMQGNINLVVVADTDLLNDLMWVQVQDFFGQHVATPFASNGDFLVNAVDHLSGSNALISLRGRAAFQRPFVRVAALARRADERTQQEEHRLRAQLQDTEQRLAALQRGRNGPSAAGAGIANILTRAQRAEVANFTQRKLTIRKALRQVQRDLTTDIEHLGTILKVINIAAMPALLTVVVLLIALLNRRRQRGAIGTA